MPKGPRGCPHGGGRETRGLWARGGRSRWQVDGARRHERSRITDLTRVDRVTLRVRKVLQHLRSDAAGALTEAVRRNPRMKSAVRHAIRACSTTPVGPRLK